MSQTRETGASSPPPSVIVCARCGSVIEPGLDSCPACGAPQSRPDAPGVRAGLRRLGTLLVLIAMAAGALVLWPDLLRAVHLDALADWLEASHTHRLSLLPAIWSLFVAGAVLGNLQSPRDSMRAAWAPFARAVGGELVDRPVAREAGAWQGGVEVRARVQRWLLTLDTLTEGSSTWTRLRCTVAPRRDFHFALLPQSRVLRAVTSVRLGGLLLRLGASAAAQGPRQEATRRELVEELSYVVGPPVDLGDPELDRAFLVKSDDAACARDLIGALRPQLLALHTPGSWWQLTFAASTANRTGLVEFRETGLVRDAARLEAARGMVADFLERLLAAGIITDVAAASNA